MLQDVLVDFIMRAPLNDDVLHSMEREMASVHLLDDGMRLMFQVRAYRLQFLQALMEREPWALALPYYTDGQKEPTPTRRLAPLR